MISLEVGRISIDFLNKDTHAHCQSYLHISSLSSRLGVSFSFTFSTMPRGSMAGTRKRSSLRIAAAAAAPNGDNAVAARRALVRISLEVFAPTLLLFLFECHSSSNAMLYLLLIVRPTFR